MVTPFLENGEPDYDHACKLASLLCTKVGSEGIVACGTTGESPHFTRKEQRRFFQELRPCVPFLIAGTGANSTREVLRFNEDAEVAGANALLVVVPYYNKPGPKGIYEHFATIAERTRLPIILYNVPSRTVVNLEPETVLQLAQNYPNIIGVKEASGNMQQVRKIIQLVAPVRPDFKIWSGNDSDTLKIMKLGGYGVISVASHLVGIQIKQIIDLVLQGNLKEADIRNLRLQFLYQALFLASNPIPIKHALNFVGIKVGDPMLPLLPMRKEAPEQAETLEIILKNTPLDLPVPFALQA